MLRSLTFKLAMVILGILILSNVAQTVRLLADFGAQWSERQEEIGQAVLERVRGGPGSEGVEKGVLRSAVEGGSADRGVLRLYDGSGKVVDWLGPVEGHPDITPEQIASLREVPAGRPRRLRRLAEGLAIGLRLDTGPQGPERYLVYSQPREPAPWIRAIQRLAQRNLIIASVLAAVAALLLARWLRRRLDALGGAFRKVAAGDLSTRVPEPRERELAGLARSFNHMATELEKAQAASLAAEQERRSFMAQASHELRTPLTAMQGYLETLTMAGFELSDEDRRRYLDRAFLESQELGHRVEDLVELVRLERPGFRLSPGQVELGAIFEELARRYEPLAASAGVVLRGLDRPPAFSARWDQRRVVQALGNLIHNAVKASPRGAAVTVEAAPLEAGLRIAVVDEGPGLAGYEDPAGLGLGLKIVRLLTERHGGTLRLEAAGPKGLRAILELPADPEMASSEAWAGLRARRGRWIRTEGGLQSAMVCRQRRWHWILWPTPSSASGSRRMTERTTIPADLSPTKSLPADPKLSQPAWDQEDHGTGTLFCDAQSVGGRYRIVRFIDRGGMGEVYEAEDLELGERVALKAVRPHLARDQNAVERFKREMQLARKVTHGNVCRLFEFGQHLTGQGQRILFLTMELLEGETLCRRLRRDGPISEAQALPLLRQMCAGLGAAHEAGVVHRDFKTQNVMLVGRGSRRFATNAASDGGFRVVVTDFGLARSSSVELDPGTSLTGPARILGTPATMAPEQLTGGPITPATDIYALGTVLFELLTGVLPFSGEMPGLLYRRLAEPPPSPRQHAPWLDPRWEAAVLRCLERDAGRRFQSVAELLQALDAGPMPAAAPAATARRSLAVLGFKNLSGRSEAAWLSTALSEMLGTELAAGERLRIAPGESVARARLESALPEAESFSPETLRRIRRSLGVDILVLGSFIALGPASGSRLRFDLRLQDAVSTEVLCAVQETGTELEPFDLVSRAGVQLRNTLGIGGLSAAEQEQVRASLPQNPEAARLYAEGLARFRLFDLGSARELLEKAAALETEHALTYAALADVRVSLGHDAEAEVYARRAFERAGSLSRQERLLIEARCHQTTRQWDKAAELFHALCAFFPDHLEFGIQLAITEHEAGRPQAALEAIDRLHALPPPACEDPRIDIFESCMASYCADCSRALSAAARAVAKGQALEAPIVVAMARKGQAWVLGIMGERDKAIAAFEEARQIFASVGDRRSLSEVLGGIGGLFLLQGKVSEAREILEECLSVSRGIGDRCGVASALDSLAMLLERQGDLAGARRLYEEALATLGGTGFQLAAIEKQLRLASLRFRQGDLEQARALAESLLTSLRQHGDPVSVARIRLTLGRICLAAGQLEPARGLCSQVLSDSNAAGVPWLRPWARLLEAQLANAEHDFAAAEPCACEAREAFRAQGFPDSEASAEVELALCLLARDRHAEARAAIDAAVQFAARSHDLGTQLAVAIAGARVRAVSGDASERTEAIHSLQATLERAVGPGFFGEALEARLVLGELELASGFAEASRGRLSGLQREAAARGFWLIAARAEAALGGR